MAVCGTEPMSSFIDALALSPLALAMYSAIRIIISTTEPAKYSLPTTDTITAMEINNSVPIFRSLINSRMAVLAMRINQKP